MENDWTTGGGTTPNPLIKRTPPHNEEAERSVIAACYTELGGFDELEVAVRPEDFHRAWHRTIWESMTGLRERKIPIDYLSVKNDLERRGLKLTNDQDTDLMLLATYTVPTAANVNYYARILVALSKKRELIDVGARIVELGYSSEKVKDILDRASDLVFKVTSARAAERIRDARTLAIELWDHLAQPQKEGVVSGWFALDELIQAFRPGELSVLAARPSMGKTSLALSLASTMLARGTRVGFVSLEMDRLQLACNTVGARSSVNTVAIRRSNFDSVDERRATIDGIEWLSGFEDRFAVFDDVLNSVTDLGRILQRMVQRYGIQIAWIDYMQLLSGSEDVRGQGRYAEITEVSIMLKRYAKKLGIHLAVLAQLNRKVEERKDKKPIMADLRDSGQVEQDADLIMLLHRPEYYKPDDPDLEGVAILDVCKNRNGPTGKLRLKFEKRYTRFEPE